MAGNELLSDQRLDEELAEGGKVRFVRFLPLYRCFGSGTSRYGWIRGVVAASALGSVLWGFHLSVIAGAMLFVDDYFHLSALWHEIIVSVTIAGAAIGAVTAGTLSDWLGRRRVLMISAVLYSVGAVVMGVAISKVFLIIGRAMIGLAIGFFSVTGPVYVSEMSPSHLRGKLGMITIFFTGGGILLGVIVAGLFSIDSKFAYSFGWRLMVGIGVLPSVTMLLCVWFLLETPRWLVFHGKVEAARDVLKRIRHVDVIEEEISDMLNEYEKSQKNKIGKLGWIKRVFHSGTLLHALFVGIGLHVFSALSGPTLMATYGATILRMAGFNTKQAIWFSTLPVVANAATMFVASLIVEKTGRRKLFIISGAGTSVCLLLLALLFLLESNASPSAIPLQEGGMYDSDKCGTCVSNSHCGFCALSIDDKYINGTCVRGSRDKANLRINGSQCTTWDNSLIYRSNNVTDYELEYHFDFCPDSKFVVLSLFSVFMYSIFVGIGFGPLPWVVNSELYPTWARGQAVAIASLCNWSATLFSAATFLTFIDITSQSVVLGMYGVITACGTLFITFLLPETNKKHLEEVEILFTKPHFFAWFKICPRRRRDSNILYSELDLKEIN